MTDNFTNIFYTDNYRHTFHDREFRYDADICLQAEQLLYRSTMDNKKPKDKKQQVRPRDATKRIPVKNKLKKLRLGI